MTKMAAMAVNSKEPFFSRTRRPMILKLGIKHQEEELYKGYIHHDPGMTLTYFTARSTYVTHAYEWGKLLKCDLEGKTCRKWTNGQNVYVYEKTFPGAICVYDHNIQTSSLKLLCQLMSNFMWSIIRNGE